MQQGGGEAEGETEPCDGQVEEAGPAQDVEREWLVR